MGFYKDRVLGHGPALYWPLDGTDGAADQSGNARDGTALGGVAVGGFADSPIEGESSCTDFDGSDDAISSAYSPFVPAGAFTLSVWARRDSTAGWNAILSSTEGWDAGAALYGESGSDDAHLYVGGSLIGGAEWAGALGAGAWMHVALTFDDDADEAELYIDGVAQGTLSGAVAYAVTPGFFLLGAEDTAGAGGWDGPMAHVALWESVLSAAVIAELADPTSPFLARGAPAPHLRLRVVTVAQGGAGQGYDLTDWITGLRWSNVRPGGDETCSFTYHRTWHASVPEIAKGSLLRVMCGLDVVWQGRIAEQDRGAGDSETIAVTAYGLGRRLKEARSAFVFVDSDLQRWDGQSAQRKLNLLAASRDPFDREITPDHKTGAPAIKLVYRLDIERTVVHEAFYVATVALGEVHLRGAGYNATLAGIAANTSIIWRVRSADDDVNTNSVDRAGGPSAEPPDSEYVPLGGQLVASLLIRRNGPSGGTQQNQEFGILWGHVVVYGNHGLAKQGSDPSGFLATQMIAYVIGQTDGIVVRRADPTTYVSRQAAYEESDHEAVIADLHRTEAHHRTWGTWGPDSVLDVSTDGYFDYRALEPTTAHWLARRSQCDDLDLQTEDSTLYNAVDVHYTDVGGRSRVLRRTRTVPELGEETRVGRVDGGTMTTEGAETLGDTYLALWGGFAPARGSVKLSQPITHHSRGELHPLYMRADASNLRVPDVLPSNTLFELSADPDRRSVFPVQRVSVDVGDKITATAELDQQNDAVSALQDRLEADAQLVGAR